MLELCGYFGSFTDACRMAVVERADQLYAFITSQSWEEGVCDLAGVCSEVYLCLIFYILVSNCPPDRLLMTFQ